MTLSLPFSQRSFEQNVSVQRKLMRFSAIYLLFRNKARNAGRSRKNAGNKPKCRISHTIAGRLTPMPYCRLLFTTDGELCDHIRTQHADRRYSCLQFPRTFVSMGVLNSHVRNKHQKLVKFRCQICGKGYDDRRNDHDHIAAHAGVKRNVCTIRQAQFTFEVRAQFESACSAFSSGRD